MHHDPQQLDALWQALTGSDPAARDEAQRRYANLAHPGERPHVACDDGHAQVLSIPRPDHPGRHVYARRPGGAWSELL